MPLSETCGNEPEVAESAGCLQTPREARVTTILLIGKLISPHGEGLCRIRNLSNGGLMAEVHVPLEKGNPVQIELKAGDRLSGQVRWSRERRIGIAFDEPVEVGTLLARTTMRTLAHGLARAPRFAVDCSIELRCGGRRHAGRLINVSQGGARLQADFKPERDQLLNLAIPGLPEKRGGLRWARDGILGLAFVEPLAFEELGCWLAGQNGEA